MTSYWDAHLADILCIIIGRRPEERSLRRVAEIWRAESLCKQKKILFIRASYWVRVNP